MDLEDCRSDWASVVDGVDTVFHLGGRVHISGIKASDRDKYRRCNVEGTLRLAEACARAGTRRLVFSSSLLVHGRYSDEPLAETDEHRPFDAYTKSKSEAEAALVRLSEESSLEVTILRLPMTYGPGAAGNFPRLTALVRRGIPLPLARVRNQRSFLGIRNAVSAFLYAAEPDAETGVFLISDQEAVSIGEFIERIANAMGANPRLFWCPPSVLEISAALIGRSRDFDRLCRSLWVNDDHTIQVLGWLAPFTMQAELENALGRV
jgi:UDP-glucose 4-epimerase